MEGSLKLPNDRQTGAIQAATFLLAPRVTCQSLPMTLLKSHHVTLEVALMRLGANSIGGDPSRYSHLLYPEVILRSRTIFCCVNGLSQQTQHSQLCELCPCSFSVTWGSDTYLQDPPALGRCLSP